MPSDARIDERASCFSFSRGDAENFASAMSLAPEPSSRPRHGQQQTRCSPRPRHGQQQMRCSSRPPRLRV